MYKMYYVTIDHSSVTAFWQKYLNKFSYGSATTDDLLNELNEVYLHSSFY